ncbi:MAG: hypothetical protein V4466_10245, partial [Pseudomonadota bacterium]
MTALETGTGIDEGDRADGRTGRGSGRPRRRTWMAAGAVIVGCHAALVLALLTVKPQGWSDPPQATASVMATLIEPPPPPPPPAPDPEPEPTAKPSGSPAPATAPEPAKPAAKKKPLPPARLVIAKPPPDVEPLVAAKTPSNEPSVVLGEADIAGAARAGPGSGGGDGSGGGSGSGAGAGGGQCDMVRRLQDALRSDPEVRSAATRAHRSLGPGGKAILVWNGDWLRSPDQDGRGLAGVRQAIAMEVAFAPAACRAAPMRGLVVIA